MPQKKIVLPSKSTRPVKKNHYIGGKKEYAPKSPIRLSVLVNPDLQVPHPTLVFRRRRPSLTYAVPPVWVPLYWFTKEMLDRGYITRASDTAFFVDGRRFIAIAQDYHTVGRFGYTRWLVYEEAALPKGQRP